MNTATWNEKESAARKRSHVRSDVPCQDDNGTIAASAESSIHVRRDLKQPAVQSAEPTKTIRVLLVDDHPVVRKGLRCALSGCEQIAIVGEAADGLEAMRMAKELLPHLVLMDIDMPHMNGLMVAERLTNDNPQIKVLVLSMHGDPDNILSILQCGARGFVLKDAPAEDLVRAIERVDSGETFFSVEAERMVINQFVSHRPEEPRTSQLTKREREVLGHRRWFLQQGDRLPSGCGVADSRSLPQTDHEQTQHLQYRRPHPVHAFEGLDPRAELLAKIKISSSTLLPARSEGPGPRFPCLWNRASICPLMSARLLKMSR
jgi:two-component system response regulator NreC